MNTSKTALVLNIRSRTLTGEIAGKSLKLSVILGSGLLAQATPGLYTIQKPVNDPALGLIATVGPAGGAGTVYPAAKVTAPASKIAAPAAKVFAQPLKVGQTPEAGQTGDGRSFVMTTKSMGGWNDLVVTNGTSLMMELQRAGDVTLQVV